MKKASKPSKKDQSLEARTKYKGKKKMKAGELSKPEHCHRPEHLGSLN